MFYADLHIHSKYSRATSRAATLSEYYNWARIKGISVVSTGDFTHPAWIQAIRDELTEDGSGLLTLKTLPQPPLETENISVRFILTTEISLIYKKNQKTRKIHHVVLAPSIECAAKLNGKLGAIGNIKSDGRPILGITSLELLKIVKDTSPDAYVIPAHIWTPWFSLFGSNSGYDAIEECFEDMTPEIFALETGLSSDPSMNWRLSALDRFSLVSNSDAHSPAKLGREACVFETDMTYNAIIAALRKEQPGYRGTVEFFPEEGKYHLDGHRNCNVVIDPTEKRFPEDLCPACGKKLTIGVLHRVVDLADRKHGKQPAAAPGFKYFVPLPEILAQILHTSTASVKVAQRYNQIIPLLGNEYNLVEKLPLADIEKVDPYLARAVRNIRDGKVTATAGYDGEFGVIRPLTEQDFTELAGQTQFLVMTAGGGKKKKDRAETRRKSGPQKEKTSTVFTPAQEKIINADTNKNILVHAGPGSGKTRVLVERLKHLTARGVAPESILVLTFTNRAVDEIKQRLADDPIAVATFHGFCLSVLKDIQPDTTKLYHEPERTWALRKLFPALSAADIQKAVQQIGTGTLDATDAVMLRYSTFLREQKGRDIGLIIGDFIALDQQGALTACKQRYTYIFVDEFQDSNAQQHAMLLLFHPAACFLVIGDPDQAIYAWRGARPDLFFDFAGKIGAIRYRLDTNFRSRPNIVGAAGALIARNRSEHLEMKTSAAAGQPVEFLRPDRPEDEAKLVIERIEDLLGGTQMHRSKATHLAPADIAVLYRSRIAGAALRAALVKTGIPVEIRGEDWLENPALQLVAACLRCLTGPDVLEMATILSVTGMMDRKGLKSVAACTTLEEVLEKHQPARIISDTIQSWRGLPLDKVLESVFENFKSIIPDDGPLIRQMARLAGRFNNDPVRFLESINTNPFLMSDDVKPQGLVLSTFHGAKGLEFGAVFIIGAVDGITPSVYNHDLEEERRLFYVAMTRAKERLFISSPAKVTGHDPRISGQPSRFVDEIKTFLTEKKDPRARQLDLFR